MDVSKGAWVIENTTTNAPVGIYTLFHDAMEALAGLPGGWSEDLFSGEVNKGEHQLTWRGGQRHLAAIKAALKIA